MKVITLYSTKGGVGKTTAAVNLAWEASRSARVLLWDLDPQGASTFLFDVKPKLRKGAAALVEGRTAPSDVIRPTSYPDLDVIPADDSYRDLDVILDGTKKAATRVRRVLDQVKDYDLVVLDCPPGESLVARNAVGAADLVLVPLSPSPLARRSLEQVHGLMADTGADASVLAFLSMVDQRKTVHRQALQEAPGDGIAAVVIPAASVVEQMGARRAPIGVFAAGTSAGHAFADLAALATDTVGLRIKKGRRTSRATG